MQNNLESTTKRKFTIKDATFTMLSRIKGKLYEQNGWKETIKDKDIAKKIGVNAQSYSRLITGVSTPGIMTWFRILNLHTQLFSREETDIIINKLLYVPGTDNDTESEPEGREQVFNS